MRFGLFIKVYPDEKTKGWTIVKKADTFHGENFSFRHNMTVPQYKTECMDSSCFVLHNGSAYYRNINVNECIDNMVKNEGCNIYIPAGASMKRLKKKEKEGFEILYNR